MDEDETGQPENVAEPDAGETEERIHDPGIARMRLPEDSHLLFEVNHLEELHVAPDGSKHLHPTGESCMHVHLFPGAPPDVLAMAELIERTVVDMFRLHAEMKGKIMSKMPEGVA